jgi:hypothetical protein
MDMWMLAVIQNGNAMPFAIVLSQGGCEAMVTLFRHALNLTAVCARFQGAAL